MNDHMNMPGQPTGAEEPVAATRREQREQEQGRGPGDQAPARQSAAAAETARMDATEGDVADQARDRHNAAPAETARPDVAEADAVPEPVEHSATTDHDVIRQWAEDRHATPAMAEGGEPDAEARELRFDFDFGNDLEDLAEVSWDEWFRAFDERGLEFVFQETTRPDGSASNDFRLEPAGGMRT